MTIVVPLLLFVWFIAAFLWDGNSYRNLRNRYDRNHLEQSKNKVRLKMRAFKRMQNQPGIDGIRKIIELTFPDVKPSSYFMMIYLLAFIFKSSTF